jgi:hypothetical protein
VQGMDLFELLNVDKINGKEKRLLLGLSNHIFPSTLVISHPISGCEFEIITVTILDIIHRPVFYLKLNSTL